MILISHLKPFLVKSSLYYKVTVMWLNVDFAFSDVAMERLRLAARNQVALAAKWISKNFQQILFSLWTNSVCENFQNFNLFPKSSKWTSKSLSHIFIFSKCGCFLEASKEWQKVLVIRIIGCDSGWSLSGSDSQICQSWYCSFPLFDFFRLFPITPPFCKS